jgi:hypothetical protein
MDKKTKEGVAAMVAMGRDQKNSSNPVLLKITRK